MSRMAMAYIQGSLMTQARIQNDLEIVRDMTPGLFSLLGK